MSSGETKRCPVCGRSFGWRKKWAANWASVRYCSDACRRRKSDPSQASTEDAILDLLHQRDRGTICPSEAARVLDPEDWRDRMNDVRNAGRRLEARGILEICQRGKVVDGSTARGPIRYRLKTEPRP